jgi:hypothetical protein
MFAIIHLLATFIADLFKAPRRLEVEKPFSPPSAQYCSKGRTAPSTASWE